MKFHVKNEQEFINHITLISEVNHIATPQQYDIHRGELYTILDVDDQYLDRLKKANPSAYEQLLNYR